MSTAGHVETEMDLKKVVRAQPDFKHERPDLQHFVETRGHILQLFGKGPLGHRGRTDRVFVGYIEDEVSAGDQRRDPGGYISKYSCIYESNDYPNLETGTGLCEANSRIMPGTPRGRGGWREMSYQRVRSRR